LTILRLATVIGEEDKGNFLHLIRSIDRGFFIWIGKGENRKSLVHREDAARACGKILAVEKVENNGTEIFNLSANFLTMRRIVEIVGEKLEKKIPDIFIPAAFFKPFFQLNAVLFNVEKIKRAERTIAKWLADDVYSAEKLKRVYGFETRVSAEKAIEREVEWYIANK
jgi:nucleoside-diphosphate-sugar epimerase